MSWLEGRLTDIDIVSSLLLNVMIILLSSFHYDDRDAINIYDHNHHCRFFTSIIIIVIMRSSAAPVAPEELWPILEQSRMSVELTHCLYLVIVTIRRLFLCVCWIYKSGQQAIPNQPKKAQTKKFVITCLLQFWKFVESYHGLFQPRSQIVNYFTMSGMISEVLWYEM